MQLTNQLAQEIAEQTAAITGYQIFIVNPKGIIIGASERDRVGKYHEASALVIQEKRRLDFSATEAQKLKGVRPGIVWPIFVNGSIIGVVGITGDPEEVGKFGELLRNQVEMMCHNSLWQEVMQLTERAEEKLVYDLVTGRISEATAMNALMLGYNLSLPRLALTIKLETENKTIQAGHVPSINSNEVLYNQILKENLLRLIKSRRYHPEDIVSQRVPDQIIILASFDPEVEIEKEIQRLKKKSFDWIAEIQNTLNFNIRIGMGSYYQELTNLHLSYKEARQALKIGEIFDENSQFFYISDLGLEYLISEINPAVAHCFLAREIRALMKDKDHQVLIDTIQSFCHHNLNITETARALYIHRNTLLYRLGKIERLTGLNPRDFRDAAQLYAGCQFQKNKT